MSRPSYIRLAPALFGMMLLAFAGARAAQVNDIHWKGADLFIRFSDSVFYRVDLTETDTAQLVIRIAGATAEGPMLEGELNGPEGIDALLTKSGANEIRLTVHRPGRIGYASVWRPYSHTLVVHTFDWDNLDYPREQYFKGLLALEQGLDVQAGELLQVAHSTGEGRAASVLGVYYARRGDFAQAASLLATPVDADDYAALADVQAHNGDTAAARASRSQFERMIATGPTPTGRPEGAIPRRAKADRSASGGQTLDGGSDSGSSDNGLETNEMIRERAARKWIFLGGGVIALLLLIGVVVWLSRRAARRPVPAYAENDPATTGRPTPRAPRREPPVAPDLTIHPAEAIAPEAPVEATVTESRQHTVAAEHATAEPVKAEPVKAEPVRTEPVQAEPIKTEPTVVETVVVEAIAAEPTVRQRAPEPTPVVVEAPKAAPVASAPVADANVVEAKVAEAPPVADDTADVAQGARSAQKQAADLRRRIEAMRAPAPPPSTPKREPSSAGESTISEARRLHLSRDSVELRRMLQQKRR